MNSRRLLLVFVALVVAVIAAACGSKKGTPVNYSAPVDITINVKSSDVTNNVATTVKNINTVPGNPFGAFVNDAKAKLGGADPSSIGLNSLVLTMTNGGTASITALNQVYAGPVAITFQMNSGTAEYPVGTGTVSAATTATMNATFDSTQMTPADYALLLGGQFKVAVVGTAAAGFGNGNKNVPLKATFTFEAFK